MGKESWRFHALSRRTTTLPSHHPSNTLMCSPTQKLLETGYLWIFVEVSLYRHAWLNKRPLLIELNLQHSFPVLVQWHKVTLTQSLLVPLLLCLDLRFKDFPIYYFWLLKPVGPLQLNGSPDTVPRLSLGNFGLTCWIFLQGSRYCISYCLLVKQLPHTFCLVLWLVIMKELV